VGPSGTVAALTQTLNAINLAGGLPQVVPGSVSFTTSASDGTVTAWIEADGDVMANGVAGTYGVFELRLVVDGATLRVVKGQVTNMGTANESNTWTVTVLKTLSPGAHEVHLETRSVMGTANPVTLNYGSGRVSVLLVRP
jgi:hypothetical protein